MSIPLSALARIIRSRQFGPGSNEAPHPDEEDADALRDNLAAQAKAAAQDDEAAFQFQGSRSIANDRVARSSPPLAYNDIPAPPAPPQLQPVVPSRPMPQYDPEHGGTGDSRFADAWEVARSGLRQGGLAGLVGGFLAGLVNPKAGHKLRYQQQLADWEQTAKPEIGGIEAANRGKIQQAQRDEAYWRGQESREKMIDTRVTRGQREEDRQRTISDAEANRRHQQAKDAVNIAAETGTTVNPAAVKDTVFEQYAGQKLSRQQRDRLFKMSDALTGEQSIYNVDTGERTVIPGVSGRVEREPKGPDYQAPHTILNEATGDKAHFENMKDVELPKARGQVQRLQTIYDSLQGDESALPIITDPEIAAMLNAMPGANRQDKRAAVGAALQKAKGEADQLQKRMHTHLEDMRTKYSKHGNFLEIGGTGDYPYVKLHPEVLGSDEEQTQPTKRTGLLDIPSQRVKR